MSFQTQETGAPQEPHRGTLILVLGILSLTTCGWVAGFIAWILANDDLKKMRQGLMDRAGENNTNAGRIMGIISIALSIVSIVFLIIWFVFVGALVAFSRPHPFR